MPGRKRFEWPSPDAQNAAFYILGPTRMQESLLLPSGAIARRVGGGMFEEVLR
jgi:hypothetical protein